MWVSSSQDFVLRFLDAGQFPVVWSVHSKCQMKASCLCSASPWLFAVRWLGSLGVTWKPVLQLLLCIHNLEVTRGNHQLMCSHKQKAVLACHWWWRPCFKVLFGYENATFEGAGGRRWGSSLLLLQWYRAQSLAGGCCCCYTELTSIFVFLFLSSFFLFF